MLAHRRRAHLRPDVALYGRSFQGWGSRHRRLQTYAAEKTHLNTKGLPSNRVQITDDEVPLHVSLGASASICAPLVASEQLFGVINIEYTQGLTADLVTDDRLLIQLANQVAVGIRNAKLIDELTFVRKYLEELLESANALILVTNRERQVLVFKSEARRPSLSSLLKDGRPG